MLVPTPFLFGAQQIDLLEPTSFLFSPRAAVQCFVSIDKLEAQAAILVALGAEVIAREDLMGMTQITLALDARSIVVLQLQAERRDVETLDSQIADGELCP